MSVCVSGGEEGAVRREVQWCLTCRAKQKPIPPDKGKCASEKRGWQLGEIQPVQAGFPIPLRQLSHGTETPSALWKGDDRIYCFSRWFWLSGSGGAVGGRGIHPTGKGSKMPYFYNKALSKCNLSTHACYVIDMYIYVCLCMCVYIYLYISIYI